MKALRRVLGLWMCLAVSGAAAGEPLWADGFATREEALAAAFPDALIRSEILFLTEAQKNEAEALSGSVCPTSLIARYTALKDGKTIGRAYVDTHVVRTKRESLLIILDAEGVLKRIEITAFLESPEHQATPAWYRQYEGRTLSDDLYLDRAIRPIAGATLTARATNQAVRRVLAIDQVLRQKAGGRP